jgi:RHS repeat-associated protein
LDSDFGFTGHYYHSPSALHLAPYRAYDAMLGRWLSRDPILEQGGINLYGYVGNNSTKNRDPSGLVWGMDWLDNPSFDTPLQFTSNFAAGFGDGLSLGLTNLAREGLGYNGVVDKCSGSYNTGWWSGFAYSFALPGVGSLNGGAKSVFYSGSEALEAARLGKGSGIILSETLGGKALTAINAPEWAFKGASAIFAANAKGEAQVFLRVTSRSNSIWRTTERPVLNWFGNTTLIFK